MTEEKRKPGRPRRATPVRTKEGHSARVWVEKEGEKVRVSVKLGTKSKVVATARSKRVLRGEASELFADKSEPFEAAATMVLELSTIKDKKKMLGRLINHAFPIIGDIPVSELTSVHVLDVLDEMAGPSKVYTGNIRNVRDAISKVLGVLVERRVLDVNEALRVKMKGRNDTLGGKKLRKVRPPRAVLTDEEFGPLIAWLATECRQSPHAGRGRRALEHLALYLCARVFGMRSSDCWAWRWEMIDLIEFSDAYVPNQKVAGDLLDDYSGDEDEEAAVLEAWRDEPRRTVPAVVAGWLRLWWEASGRPVEGPVWPVRKGKRAGQTKKAGAHALRLRGWLWRAGVTRARAGGAEAKTRADCILQTGIPRRVSATDFHSLRRAAATAAGRAVATKELSLRAAMALTQHSDPAEFAKYQAREERIVVPESAVPAVVAAPLPVNPEVECKAEPKTALGEEIAMDGKSGRPTHEAHHPVVSPGFSHHDEPSERLVTRGATTERQYSLPVFESLDGALEVAVQLAMREGDMVAAKALLDVAERRRATLPDNVLPIGSAKKGGKP